MVGRLLYEPQTIERRTLELHRLVARKARQNPARFEQARAILARWRQIVDIRSQPYLKEWERIFAEGMEAALTVALEETEAAAALRKSSPLACVLTNEERLEFVRDWRARIDALEATGLTLAALVMPDDQPS